MRRLLVTDLDNTLYDWVTYFAHAFEALCAHLSSLLDVAVADLEREFQEVHRKHGNSEHPFAALELPSVAARFPGLDRRQLNERLAPAFEAFSERRAAHLSLYPGVAASLRALQRDRVTIVGHTESIGVNAFNRLRRLEILPYFDAVYSIAGTVEPHPDPLRQREATPPTDTFKDLPKSLRKPNSDALRKICAEMGSVPAETFYVGDSIPKDIAMAREAGALTIWARYGTKYDRNLWPKLVRITHWTSEDVEREARLREASSGIIPDFTVDSFPEVAEIVMGRARRPVRAVSG